MKAKALISAILVVITAAAFLFNFPKTGVSTPPPGNDDFIIGVLDAGAETGYDRFNELNLNLWSKYTEHNRNMGWVTFHNNFSDVDWRDAQLIQYQSYVFDVMNENATNNMLTLMMRPKIEYLAYGQRSDYQCESEEYYRLNNPTPDYWFYTYNNHPPNVSTDYTDNSGFGQGIKVRYSRTENSTNQGPWVHQAGYVVSGLKTNREQCANTVYSSDYQKDARYRWYVKPRIRIEPSEVINNPNKQVCKIEMYNFEGNLMKSVDIKALNFSDGVNVYDGSYLEGFFRLPDMDSLAIGPNIVFNPNGGNWEETNPNDPNYSEVDFKVYWYGQCDMWIDYVRVDNQTAHDLFNHIYDNTWLSWEVDSIANQRPNNVFRFYIEEFEFNNRPCMKYVNDKIKALSSEKFSLMCNPYWGGYNIHKPNVHQHPFTKDEFKRTLFEYVGLREIFMGSYAFKGYYDQHPGYFTDVVYIPSTLGSYSPNNGVFAEAVTPPEFDEWLQGYLDDPSFNFWQRGEFRLYNETCDYISKALNIPVYTIVQTHLWYTLSNIYREPSNEELDLLVNLPISYGSRGMIYFWYTGWGNLPEPDLQHNTFGRGLTNPLNTWPPTYEKRTTNVYNQNKWGKIVEINGRLKTWGPTLMSFTNSDRKSYIYRLGTEREALFTNSYFRSIASYKPGNPLHNCAEWLNPQSNPPPSEQELEYECQENTYLQVATFETGNNEDVNYFMIVNRRCSPVKQGYTDGKRKIKVLFDNNHSEMYGYNVWKLEDLGNIMGAPITFDKTQNLYVDLDWFEPGEGRLYRMTPVIKSGGTLIGNEYITSGEEFTCEDTVWTNGYNLTIEDGVTIHFSDSAKFVVNGGTFQIGNPQHTGPNTINMSGESSNWKGFEFNNATVKIYGVNFSGLANDSIAMLNMIDCPLIDLRSNSFSLGVPIF